VPGAVHRRLLPRDGDGPVDRQRGDLPAAATANWVSNLAVAQSFLSLTQATIGPAWTFLILGALSVAAVVRLRAGDQGALPIEEVEKMLDARHPRRRKGIECFWVISEIVGTSRLKLNTDCKSFLVSCQFFLLHCGPFPNGANSPALRAKSRSLPPTGRLAPRPAFSSHLLLPPTGEHPRRHLIPPDGDQRRTRSDRHLQGGTPTYLLAPPCTCTHATCSAFCLTRHPGRGAGEGQAGGGGDAVRAVQDAPDLRLPHQAGGAHRDRHQELPPARAPGARHQRGPGQARRHLRLRDEGAAEDPRAVHAFGSTAAV
jgi:hypothetical protein